MITTLAGPNNFLRSRQLSQLIHKFSQIHGDMAIEKIDGEEASFDDITSSLSSLSFLTPAKLVVLNSPSAQKQFAENINELL